ncbi:MAG TPA: GAF domain-containing protein [Phycisphaerales bacterium]|nr:GAF domain-containing protein [Phycisphaerales bacterium]
MSKGAPNPQRTLRVGVLCAGTDVPVLDAGQGVRFVPAAAAHDLRLIVGDGAEVARLLKEPSRRPTAVALAPGVASIEAPLVGEIVRSGVSDVIRLPVPAAELAERLRAVSKRGRASARDRALCEQLSGACGQLAAASRELADRMEMMRTASELETLLRQELDAEALLRTTLEFLLRRVGNTNAAIFLPDSAGDFSLGAYVNYDCPRDSAQGMFDDLCGVLAPAIAGAEGRRVIADAGAFRPIADAGLTWMRDATIAATVSHGDGECRAITCVFRDKRHPWDDRSVALLSIIGGLFAQQFERAKRTSGRHLPGGHWHLSDDEDRGMAA